MPKQRENFISCFFRARFSFFAVCVREQKPESVLPRSAFTTPSVAPTRQITDHQRIHTRARDSRNEPISDQRHITSDI
jgi:hypothetical protein